MNELFYFVGQHLASSLQDQTAIEIINTALGSVRKLCPLARVNLLYSPQLGIYKAQFVNLQMGYTGSPANCQMDFDFNLYMVQDQDAWPAGVARDILTAITSLPEFSN